MTFLLEPPGDDGLLLKLEKEEASSLFDDSFTDALTDIFDDDSFWSEPSMTGCLSNLKVLIATFLSGFWIIASDLSEKEGFVLCLM